MKTSATAPTSTAAILAILLLASTASSPGENARGICKIMPVGDSITEGGAGFVSYRYPLWEKLISAGYLFEYVGTRSAASRIGPLKHEGYSGKNAEFLAQTVAENFRKQPADIVLLATGHNHSIEENPVPGIIQATESMIASFRAANPKVAVLVAQVIPSGKLPKYEYIPRLNDEIAKLAERLNTADQPVIAVNLAEGFDWKTDAVADKVHPNARGAEKIATKWFEALSGVMEKPGASFNPRIVTYKTNGSTELKLHVFEPPSTPETGPRPVIVFFFGGGWTSGTPLQFYPECAHFAEKGMVAISADYRIKSVNGTTPFESVSDGKSAIRWVRQHAKELNIDSNRIFAAGASAGGHVAAATGTVPGLDEPGEDQSVSSRPNGMILLYPTVDNGPGGYGYDLIKDRYPEISPLHNITKQTPPTLFVLGTKDHLIPVATANEFKARMNEAGVRCVLELIEGAGHPIYEYRKGDSPHRGKILSMADDFLATLPSEN